MITHKQLSLADIFTDCQHKFGNDTYQFLEFLENTINLDEIVPVSFISHFHAATGRPCKHLLYPMLRALLLQLIFPIPTTSLLIVFLKYSQQLQDFCGLPTLKFVCSKMKWEYNKETGKSRRVCYCKNSCTDSSCGRMFYIYPEKNLWAYPGTLQRTEEWNFTHKIRVNVEKSINHFKDSFHVARRKTQNEKILHAGLLLAGITQLITVMVADKIHKHQYIRSLKPLNVGSKSVKMPLKEKNKNEWENGMDALKKIVRHIRNGREICDREKLRTNV